MALLQHLDLSSKVKNYALTLEGRCSDPVCHTFHELEKYIRQIPPQARDNTTTSPLDTTTTSPLDTTTTSPLDTTTTSPLDTTTTSPLRLIHYRLRIHEKEKDILYFI